MDIDLEKFFDTVPQDRRLSLVHSIIEDGEMESLIRKYFHSGVFVNGQNQWKKKSRRLWCLPKLGFSKWIADKVSGWGDRAQRSVLKRDISKPVLEKRGLVFCFDTTLSGMR